MSNHESLEDVLRRLDRPVAPSAEFKEKLERRLMAELGQPIGAQGGINKMDQSAPAPRTWRDSTETSSNRRTWLPVLEIAAVVLIALGIGVVLLGSRGMLPGQSEDNHAAIQTEYPITPDPSECTVEPRTLEEVEALVPDYSQSFPSEQEPEATPPLTLQHHEASEETRRGIEAAYREIFACTNAGDLLRTSALYTDDFLRSGGISRDDIQDPPTPTPADEWTMILDVSYVREFEDGHAGAVVVLNTTSAPAAIYAVFLVFEKVGDRWLLDGFPPSSEHSSDVSGEEGWGTPITMEAMPVETPTVVQRPTETP